MPKTRGQSIFFTAITAWMMVYVMTLYNSVIGAGKDAFTNQFFLYALKDMWIEYIIIFLLAFFVASKLAAKCAFRVVRPGDRQIAIIFAIQTFTVVWMVTFASVIGLYHAYGFHGNVLPHYLICWVQNFIMALPLQLFFVGPLARLIFRCVFLKDSKGNYNGMMPQDEHK